MQIIYLRNRDDVLNVFITGNKKEKMDRICKLYEKTDAEAEKLLCDIDKKRSVQYKYYTNKYGEWRLIIQLTTEYYLKE